MLIISCFFVLVGCGPSQSKEEVAESFWRAVDAQDVDALKSLVMKPENAERFGPDGTTRVKYESYKVVGKSELGAEVRFERFCYPDAVAQTVITELEGKLRVNVNETIREIVEASVGQKPTREYCYSFEDQPLKGKLNGKSWSARSVYSEMVGSGSDKEEWTKLYLEDCEEVDCSALDAVRLNVSNLDLAGAGGNFGPKENITITIPPHNNIIVTTGSYKISEIGDGKNKLEISFEKGPDNHLNGYIVF
jgi:hypothetical protein